MAPSNRFLLPVSLLILFLALVATEDHLASTMKTLYEEARPPLKNSLQSEDESEENALEYESQDIEDSDPSQNYPGEEADIEGTEGELMEEGEEEEEEDQEDESPFSKKTQDVERTPREEQVV